MANELRIYPRHIRSCGYCLTPGARDWFIHYGLDWRDFIKSGIPAPDLAATGGPMVEAIVAFAQREAEAKNE